MKKLIISFIGLGILFTSCQNTKSFEKKILKLEGEKEELYEQLRDKGPDSGELVHIVFLRTKVGTSTVDRQMYLDEIMKYNRLDYIHDLHVGIKADMKDDRSITNNDAFFSMIFKNINDYYKWKDGPEHQELKKYLDPYLAEEPITYDYFVQ